MAFVAYLKWRQHNENMSSSKCPLVSKQKPSKLFQFMLQKWDSAAFIREKLYWILLFKKQQKTACWKNQSWLKAVHRSWKKSHPSKSFRILETLYILRLPGKRFKYTIFYLAFITVWFGKSRTPQACNWHSFGIFIYLFSIRLVVGLDATCSKFVLLIYTTLPRIFILYR